jgi:hypothetical protein
MSNVYRAVVESDNVLLYLADAGDPEEALEAGVFTENPSEAQLFEGIGWLNQVAGFGASLEMVS